MKKSLPSLLVLFLFHYAQRRYNSIVVIKRILRDRGGLKGAKTKQPSRLAAVWHRQAGGRAGREAGKVLIRAGALINRRARLHLYPLCTACLALE